MSRNVLYRSAARPGAYVCPRCTFRLSQPNSRRFAHTTNTATGPDGDGEQVDQKRRTGEGKSQSLLTLLEERGYIKEIAGYVSSWLEIGI